MINISKIDNFEELAKLSEQWQELFDQSDYEQIFLAWDFVKVWWDCFGSEHRLYVLLAEEDNRLLGIAPLMLSVRGHEQIIQLIGTPENDYADFIVHRDHSEIVDLFVDYLKEHQSDWDRIRLTQIPEQSLTLKRLRLVLATDSTAYLIEPIETCVSFRVEDLGDNRSSFSLKRNANTRNKINRLKKEAELSFDLTWEKSEIIPQLPTLFHYHFLRWRSTPTPSHFRFDSYTRFKIELTRQLSSGQKIMLAILKHGDVPLAYWLGFRGPRSVGLYTLAHNAYYSRYSPGNIISHYVIDALVRQGIDEVDFMRGNEQYKYRFSNFTSTNYQVTIYRKKTAYWFDYLYGGAKRLSPIRAAIGNKSIQKLKNAVRAACSPETSEGILATATTWFRNTLNGNQPDHWLTRSDSNAPETPPGKTVITELHPDRLDRICAFLGVTFKSAAYDVLNRRYESKACCFAAERDGHIAAVCWVARQVVPGPTEARDVELGPGQAALFGFESSPILCNGTTSAELISGIVTRLTDEKRQVLARVPATNHEFFRLLREDRFLPLAGKSPNGNSESAVPEQS